MRKVGGVSTHEKTKGGTLRALAMGVRRLEHGSGESQALRTSGRATRIEIL